MSRHSCKRHRRVGSAIALLALLVGAAPALAQGTIQGLVSDQATMRPLNSVQVFIGTLNLGTLSDTRGQFVINGVPASTRCRRS